MKKKRISKVVTGLPYNPGTLPTQPAPLAGETITLKLKGLPPYKEIFRSIRNPRHPLYRTFVALRNEASRAMNGRTWYRGPIGFRLLLFSRDLPRNRRMLDYVEGIFDTLDGSHGPGFTYLPIVYEDDCQVVNLEYKHIKRSEEKYHIIITFL